MDEFILCDHCEHILSFIRRLIGRRLFKYELVEVGQDVSDGKIKCDMCKRIIPEGEIIHFYHAYEKAD